MSAVPVVIPQEAPLEWPRAERSDCHRLLTRRRELAAELADAECELAAAMSEVQAATRRRNRALIRKAQLVEQQLHTEGLLKALARKAGKAGHVTSE